MTAPAARLGLRQKLLYSAPTFAGAAIAIPILIHMPKFYSDVVLVPVGYIALAIAVARALDAIIDPAIGWLSDHTHGRLGRRRPYIMIGAPLCAVSLYFLFTPSPELAPAQAGVWFGVTFALYFFFHAVYEIPYLGMGAELTPDYHDRSSLFGWRTAFLILGTMIASVLPAVFEPSLGPRGSISRIGAIFAVALVALFALLLVGVRERGPTVRHAPSSLVPGVRVALRNRPFMILLVTFVVASLPSAIPALLVPFYTDYVIDPPNTQKTLSMFLGLYFLTAFLCVPLWVALARRLGKKQAWLLSFGIGISAGIGLFFAGKGDVGWVAFLHVWAGIAFGAGFLLVPSMQADVIDYDELYTGKRREAQFTAFWAMVPKFVAIPGAALPIAVLALIGYVPNQEQTPQVLLGIRVIYALVPAAFAVAAFFLARLYPIDEATHAAIRTGVAAHARGESAVDPLLGRTVPPPSARRRLGDRLVPRLLLARRAARGRSGRSGPRAQPGPDQDGDLRGAVRRHDRALPRDRRRSRAPAGPHRGVLGGRRRLRAHRYLLPRAAPGARSEARARSDRSRTRARAPPAVAARGAERDGRASAAARVLDARAQFAHFVP